jgi:hypothetical protein
VVVSGRTDGQDDVLLYAGIDDVSDISIEVYREDVDKLVDAILAIVIEQTGSLPVIDRSVIVAAALGNVACRIDPIKLDHNGIIIADANGATGRLQRVCGAWK